MTESKQAARDQVLAVIMRKRGSDAHCTHLRRLGAIPIYAQWRRRQKPRPCRRSPAPSATARCCRCAPTAATLLVLSPARGASELRDKTFDHLPLLVGLLGGVERLLGARVARRARCPAKALLPVGRLLILRIIPTCDS